MKHEILKRIEKLKTKYLKKYYRKYFERIPENCKYNHQQKQLRSTNNEVLVDPDTLKPITVGICILGCNTPDRWKGDLCMSKEHAEDCPFYKDKITKGQIQKQLESELKDPNIRAEKYKDLHELYLLLKGEDIKEIEEDLTSFDRLENIQNFNNQDLLELFSIIEKELISRELEYNKEFDFETFLSSLTADDLRKKAQLIISKLSEKDPSVDCQAMENQIWDDMNEEEDSTPFENGL